MPQTYIWPRKNLFRPPRLFPTTTFLSLSCFLTFHALQGRWRSWMKSRMPAAWLEVVNVCLRSCIIYVHGLTLGSSHCDRGCYLRPRYVQHFSSRPSFSQPNTLPVITVDQEVRNFSTQWHIISNWVLIQIELVWVSLILTAFDCPHNVFLWPE